MGRYCRRLVAAWGLRGGKGDVPETMIPIIVVRYRAPDLEERCIAAVREFTDPADFDLVVHDNGEADESLAVVWNRLIREHMTAAECHSDAVVLLNTDCFLVDDQAFHAMTRALRSSALVGAVGPMTDNAGSVQAISSPYWKTRTGRDYPEQEHLGVPGGAFAGQVLVDQHISGFCLMLRTAAWLRAGGFPEDAPFYGQESALIESMWKAGFHTLICLDAFVEHLGGATAKRFLNQDEERDRGGAWFRSFRANLKGGSHGGTESNR